LTLVTAVGIAKLFPTDEISIWKALADCVLQDREDFVASEKVIPLETDSFAGERREPPRKRIVAVLPRATRPQDFVFCILTVVQLMSPDRSLPPVSGLSSWFNAKPFIRSATAIKD